MGLSFRSGGFVTSARREPQGRSRGRTTALAAAAMLAGLAAAAEEGDKGELPADAARARIEGALLAPERPKEEETKDVTPVTIVLGETESGRREVVIAPSVEAARRGVAPAAASGLREVRSGFEGREERFRTWAEGEMVTSPGLSPAGTVVLSELSTSLELACPREVTAGEPIVLHVKSVGNRDIEWDVSVVYPAGGSYEHTRLTAGDKIGGQDRIHKVSFTTWAADRGALLGVRIERRERTRDGATFWVTVR